MIVIPIGTKSTLALKPKVTITLIAVNIVIGIFTFPLMMQTEGNLVKVQRERLAYQLRLYLSEHSSKNRYDRYFDAYITEAIRDMENAEDYYELEVALMEAITYAGIDIEDLDAYEEKLAERTEIYYAASDEDLYNYKQWKRLRAREEDVLNANVIHALGLVPTKMHRAHTFITYLFLHGGIWHLLGNMLFLWVVGCLLEDSWGRGPFLVFYLAGGALAGLAHCLQDTSSTTPLIGASGAIAAAMGAFTIRHFFTRIKFFYFFIFFFRPFWGTFHLPAFVFLPFWFIQQLVMKYLTDFVGGSDVAYLAHIAGYLVGVCTALAIKGTGFEENFMAPRVQRKQVSEGVLKDPRFDEACDMMERGNIERAKNLFSQLIRERPDDLNMMQDIAVLYKEKGLTMEFGSLAGATLKNLLLKSRFEEAAELSLDAVNHHESVDINPQLLIRVGKWLAEQDRFGEAHDIFRAIIRESDNPQAVAKASLSLAKLLSGKMQNPRDAVDVLEDAEQLGLDSEWNERITELKEMIRSMHPEVVETKKIEDMLV